MGRHRRCAAASPPRSHPTHPTHHAQARPDVASTQAAARLLSCAVCRCSAAGFPLSGALSLSAEAQQALHGAYRIQAVGGTALNPRWEAFAASWAARTPAAYNAHLPVEWQLPSSFFAESAESYAVRQHVERRSLGPWLVVALPAPQEPRSCLAPSRPLCAFASVPAQVRQALKDIGSFEYDAVAAIGLLACRVAPQGALPASGLGTALWAARHVESAHLGKAAAQRSGLLRGRLLPSGCSPRPGGAAEPSRVLS